MDGDYLGQGFTHAGRTFTSANGGTVMGVKQIDPPDYARILCNLLRENGEHCCSVLVARIPTRRMAIQLPGGYFRPKRIAKRAPDLYKLWGIFATEVAVNSLVCRARVL